MPIFDSYSTPARLPLDSRMSLLYDQGSMRLAGSTIRRLRWNKGWTQEELADIAGVSERTVIRLESGESKGGPKTAKKLADALGVKVEDIVQLDNEDGSDARALATG